MAIRDYLLEHNIATYVQSQIAERKYIVQKSSLSALNLVCVSKNLPYMYSKASDVVKSAGGELAGNEQQNTG